MSLLNRIWKLAGTTPMTVYGSPSSGMVRPISRGSAAKSALPQALAQNHDACIERSVVLHERPAGDRPHAEHVEERRRDRLARNPLRNAIPGRQRLERPRDGRHRRERAILLAPIHEIERCDAIVGVVGSRFRQHHQVRGITEGKWPQQRCVEQAEDRARGADAQREHQSGEKRESGRRHEQPGGMTKVAPDSHGPLDEITTGFG